MPISRQTELAIRALVVDPALGQLAVSKAKTKIYDTEEAEVNTDRNLKPLVVAVLALACCAGAHEARAWDFD